MVDVAPFETAEAGDFEAFVAVDASRLTDGELIDRMLTVQRMRARLDAAAVAVTDRFDAGMIGAADGARTTAAWVTSRVGVSYGNAKADVELARALRDRHHIRSAHASGRLTRDQVRALLKVRSKGLEEVFDACEAILVDEVVTCTLNAGRRFLARWAQQVRERFGIPEPDGPDPSSPGGRSRASLSPVGDRWKGDLDLTAEDGEKVANVIDAQIGAFWHQGVFTDGDGMEPAERRAIALVEVIERGTRGGDEDGIARPLILGIIPLDHLNGNDGAGNETGDGPCRCGCARTTDTHDPDDRGDAPDDRGDADDRDGREGGGKVPADGDDGQAEHGPTGPRPDDRHAENPADRDDDITGESPPTPRTRTRTESRRRRRPRPASGPLPHPLPPRRPPPRHRDPPARRRQHPLPRPTPLRHHRSQLLSRGTRTGQDVLGWSGARPVRGGRPWTSQARPAAGSAIRSLRSATRFTRAVASNPSPAIPFSSALSGQRIHPNTVR